MIALKFWTAFDQLLLPALALELYPSTLERRLFAAEQNAYNYQAKVFLKYKIVPNKDVEKLKRCGPSCFSTQGVDLEGKIKAAARSALFYYLPRNYSLLHASLLLLRGKGLLLAGVSGAGKSFYARVLKNKLGATVLAKDYVVVRRFGGKLWASDINFKSKLIQKRPIEVEKIIFLRTGGEKALEPDLWHLSGAEAEGFAKESLQRLEVKGEYERDLANFWQRSFRNVHFLGLNVRRKSIKAVKTKLLTLLGNEEHRRKIEVAIVGLGSVGQVLAGLLASKSYAKRLYLLNRDKKKQRSFILDLRQALVGRNMAPEKIVGCQSFTDCLKADVIVIAIRDLSNNEGNIRRNVQLEERFLHVIGNVKNIRRFGSVLSKEHFKGVILMVSNPTEFLLWQLYAVANKRAKRYWSTQFYSVGLELDAMRARYWLKQHGYPEKEAKAFIQHGSNLWLKCFDDKVNLSVNRVCLNWVRDASAQIRRGGLRTIWGPAVATIKTIEAIFFNKAVCASTLFGECVTGGYITFKNQLPMFPWRYSQQYEKKVIQWCQELTLIKGKLGSF